MTSILGISAFYHDSAACLLKDGEIIAAAQEERFSRKKHDPSYPYNAVEFVLRKANLELSKVDQIVFFEKPFLKFERLLETYVAFAPKGFISFSKAMPLWIKEKLFQKNLLFNKLKTHDKKFKTDKNIFFSEHHLSHAASAFFPSPFDEAVILTADGVGEWATTTIAVGKNNFLEIKKEIHFPHSLGLLYSAFTYYIGFKVNSGEYKLMGLAPYGNPIYEGKIKQLIDIKKDGTFRLNQEYFNYATGLTMTNSKFDKLFGQKPRNSKNEKITQFHMDIAASIQRATEIILLKITKDIHDEYKIDNLCLAGGVALNCVANGKILREKRFKDIWVQPAAGDAGGALGAALLMWYDQNDNQRIGDKNDSMQGAYLGPSYSNDQIEIYLRNLNAVYQFHSDDELTDTISVELSNGIIIGWFQGRMEFGPRALGSRSILANPMIPDMQKKLNLKIKFRESFRPFAPAVLYENVLDWFELDKKSPYMQFVSQIKKDKIINTENDQKLFGIEQLNLIRSQIPCVTHVDYSARIQTVHKETNPRFHSLIKKFDRLTNCPVLSNTSFNIRGEPIVNSPEDAYRCFMGTDLDILVIGNYILHKSKQVNKINKNFKNEFKSD